MNKFTMENSKGHLNEEKVINEGCEELERNKEYTSLKATRGKFLVPQFIRNRGEKNKCDESSLPTSIPEFPELIPICSTSSSDNEDDSSDSDDLFLDELVRKRRNSLSILHNDNLTMISCQSPDREECPQRKTQKANLIPRMKFEIPEYRSTPPNKSASLPYVPFLDDDDCEENILQTPRVHRFMPKFLDVSSGNLPLSISPILNLDKCDFSNDMSSQESDGTPLIHSQCVSSFTSNENTYYPLQKRPRLSRSISSSIPKQQKFLNIRPRFSSHFLPDLGPLVSEDEQEQQYPPLERKFKDCCVINTQENIQTPKTNFSSVVNPSNFLTSKHL